MTPSLDDLPNLGEVVHSLRAVKQSVKRLLTKLNLDEGDVAVRIRFGRCTEAEGGFLAVEALVADAVDAGLTLATEGAGVGIQRELQRALVALITCSLGLPVQEVVECTAMRTGTGKG